MPIVTAIAHKKLPELTINDLIDVAEKHNPSVDSDLVRAAAQFGQDAHRGQMRKSGEAYFQHPLHVAFTIAELRLGTTAIVAALLHDVREDTAPEFYEQISSRFGDAVNFLVEGVTKLSKIRKLREETGSIDDLRNIFLAMTRDIRVIIIKLADRLHNLRTLSALEPTRRDIIAMQTLDIYAPIADRLGMGEIKGQLEDLAFKHAMPDKYAWVRSLVKDAYVERTRRCNKLLGEVRAELKQNDVTLVDIHGRAKRLYSLYLKLQRYGNDITQIYDLVAIRVVIPTLEDCYKTLGAVHRKWRPLVGKIKDYIATPKANGYQSLHTTVIIGKSTFVELQIRTPQMHERSERGIAATWAYAEAKRGGEHMLNSHIASGHDINWVQQLARWQKEVESPEEFFQTLKSDFFKNRIFCITPAGEVVNLPDGATPIDFAYTIHSRMGHRVNDVRVNGRRVPLEHQLSNGDIVELSTGDRHQAPKREWLDFVKTTVAKKNIKQWYNSLDKKKSLDFGRRLVSKELDRLLNRDLASIQPKLFNEYLKQHRYDSVDDLMIAIGRGERNPRQVIKRLFADELEGQINISTNKLNVYVEGIPESESKRAHCCRPIEGDKIVAVHHHNRNIIHRTECRQLAAMTETKKYGATWTTDLKRHYRVWLKLAVKPNIGVLRDIADICAKNRVSIHDVALRSSSNDKNQINILIEIKDTDELSTLMRKCLNLSEVLSVSRKYA